MFDKHKFLSSKHKFNYIRNAPSVNGWQRRETKRKKNRRTFEYTAEATRLNRLARFNWNSELVQRIARRRKVNTELKFEHSLCYAMPCHVIFMYIYKSGWMCWFCRRLHIKRCIFDPCSVEWLWALLQVAYTHACAGCVRNILISDYATWQLYAMQILH